MKKTSSLIVVTAALLAGSSSARAGKLDSLRDRMTVYLSYIANKSWSGSTLEKAPPPAECEADLKAAKKAGAKDTDTIELYPDKGGLVPKTTKGFHSGTYLVAVSELGAICDAYQQAHVAGSLSAVVTVALELESWMTVVKPEEAGSIEGMSKKPQACIDAIDASLKAGAAGGTKLTAKGEELTLDEARARCEVILGNAKEFEGAVGTREAAEKAAAEAPYKKVGMKGERLELFAYYHPMEWYLPGCTSSTDDPKKLKKAKKLFQWLTAPDGTITIRKFTFKGDKYKITEKTFHSEERAYRGCK